MRAALALIAPSAARTGASRARSSRPGRSSTGPHPDAGQIGGAERGRLGDLRDDHRDPEDVGLELHQPAVGGGAAVGASSVSGAPQARLDRPDRVDRLVGDRLERRARQVRARRCRASARRSCRARTDPSAASRVRSAPARSRRRRCRPATRASAGLGRGVDDAEPVAQPLHGGAGDEDRRLERVGQPPRRSARRRCRAAPATGGGGW